MDNRLAARCVAARKAQSHEIFKRMRDVISASVYGVVVIATVQGALGGLMFWILGLPSALVWAW
jgi:predicted PurR-regulated permease PerM